MDSSLQPVANAVYAALNVPALTAAPPDGAGAKRVTGHPTPGAFPFVWYELFDESNAGGLGAGPWVMEIDLRIHTFSQAQTLAEAQTITRTAIHLLRNTLLPILGWDHWAIFWDRNVTLPYEEINGVKVTELVALFRLSVEERAIA
jgi:hypothetical protein